MTVADVITGLGILVTLAAVWYARKAARLSQEQKEISQEQAALAKAQALRQPDLTVTLGSSEYLPFEELYAGRGILHLKVTNQGQGTAFSFYGWLWLDADYLRPLSSEEMEVTQYEGMTVRPYYEHSQEGKHIIIVERDRLQPGTSIVLHIPIETYQRGRTHLLYRFGSDQGGTAEANVPLDI